MIFYLLFILVNVEPAKKESRRERKMKEKLKEEEKNILMSLPKIDLSR